MEVKDFPNYLIYPDGRVFSKNPRSNGFMKSHLSHSGRGYFYVTLYKDGKGKIKKIHRLIAEHYIPNPDNKPIVDHKNRDKTDNRIENLRWATSSENNLNVGMTKSNTTGFKWISPDKDKWIFSRTNCKRIRINDLSKLLCYSFFYLLKYPIDK